MISNVGLQNFLTVKVTDFYNYFQQYNRIDSIFNNFEFFIILKKLSELEI